MVRRWFRAGLGWGCWASAEAYGSFGKQKCTIEIGIWWDAPGYEDNPILYAQLIGAPSAFTSFSHKSKSVRTKQSGKSTLLYLPASDKTDLNADFGTLLRELQAAAAAQFARR